MVFQQVSDKNYDPCYMFQNLFKYYVSRYAEKENNYFCLLYFHKKKHTHTWFGKAKEVLQIFLLFLDVLFHWK